MVPKNARAESFVSVDTVVSKLVAIGIPGLIILAIAATSGLAGGAATIMALSTLGGPLGILGGVAAVAILALAVDALAGETFEYIGKKVVEGLKEKGHSNDEILKEIESYPISDNLKNKIKKILPDNQIDQKNV
ncbi:MAG: hypothetical protein DU481_00390 [Nitrosomonas sp.]